MRRRSKLISVFLVICFLLTQTSILAFATEPSDLNNNWAESTIKKSVDNGIISGYPDGTFKPDKTITRAEFVTLINKAFQKKNPNETSNFSDVKTTDWFYTDVASAVYSNYIAGYPDGTFRPNNYITRQEVAVVVSRVLGLKDSKDLIGSFTDAGIIESWAKASVYSIVNSKVMNGYPNGAFRPKNFITRAEAIIVLDTAQKLQTESVTEPSTGGGGGNGGKFVNPTIQITSPTISSSYNTTVSFVYLSGNATGRNVTVSYEVYRGESGIATGNSNWVTNRINLRVGENQIKVTAMDSSGNKAYDYILINYQSDSDSDSDGLPDNFEKSIGTDLSKVDTDGDGLEDGFEYIKSLTNPLFVDTDNNGSNDDQEDTDGDLLTNVREQGLGTDPSNVDTDGDTLSDYAEITTYNTNPLNVDTDGDGLNDGDEITLGLDPTKTCTDGVTPDGERNFSQTLSTDNFEEELVDDDAVIIPSIFGNVKGSIDSNITVEVADTDVFDDNRAVTGNVINIKSNYEGMSLVLSYDVSKIVSGYDEDYAKELVVCQVSGENGLTPLTTTYDSGKISASISNRGEYLVLNVDEFLRLFGIDVMASIASESVLKTSPATVSGFGLPIAVNVKEPKTCDNNPTYEPENYTPPTENATPKITTFNTISPVTFNSAMGVADIAFVIDTTGSMGDEIYNVKENVKSFADQLVNVYNVNANFALVDFKDIVEDGNGSTYIRKNGVSNWYSNVSAFKQAVEGMSSNGGGDDPECDVDALEMSRQLDWRTTASKFIILITDAPYKVDNNYGIESMEQEISLLKDDGIVVSLITSSYLESTYQDLYTQTGGIFANIYGSFGTTLLTLADKIGEVTSKGTWIILDDFQQVRLNDPADDPDEDTDDDGIKDYSELDSEKTVNLDLFIKFLCYSKGLNPDLYKGKDSIEVWSYKSNPTRNDTENDGIPDKDDTAPKNKGLVGGIIGKLYLISCYNSEDAGWTSGHAFFAYNSYVNDNLNFKNLAAGWSKIDRSKEWSSDNILRDDQPVEEYQIKRGQYLTLGNGALGAEGLSGDGGDANGVNYNMEVYKHLTPSFGYSYLKNTYMAMEMTQDKYNDMTAHLSEDGVNKWTYTHNCATVASETWNLVSDTKVDATSWSFMLNTVATPKGLKDNLRTITGHEEDFVLADALKK